MSEDAAPMQPRADSVLAYLDRLPPTVCRLLARDLTRRRKPLSLKEISRRAGVGLTATARVLARRTWAEVSVGTADKIRSGCGVTMANQSRQIEYLRRTFAMSEKPLAHLEALPYGQRAKIRLWLEPKA